MWILNAIFPERCICCDRLVDEAAGRDLCWRCAASVISIDEDRCPRCSLPGLDDSLCVGCLLDPPPFHHLDAIFEYGGAVSEAVRRAKTRGDLAAWRAVVSWSEDQLRSKISARLSEGYVFTAVPSSGRAARRRGFEPSAVTLHWLGVPWRPLLRSVGRSTKQAGLAASSRLENARAAFEVRDDVPDRVCVFDDIVTTGSTMRSIADKLLLAGATEVSGIAIARTPR